HSKLSSSIFQSHAPISADTNAILKRSSLSRNASSDCFRSIRSATCRVSSSNIPNSRSEGSYTRFQCVDMIPTHFPDLLMSGVDCVATIPDLWYSARSSLLTSFHSFTSEITTLVFRSKACPQLVVDPGTTYFQNSAD